LEEYQMQRSDSIKELAVALCKAQSQMTAAVKDSVNPHFRSNYADLASVWEAVRKPLTENGLSVSQLVDGMELETILVHVSGEFISSRYPLNPIKADPQGLRSSITYARRTALEAIAGIAPDDDDDANLASQPVKPTRPMPDNRNAGKGAAVSNMTHPGPDSHDVRPLPAPPEAKPENVVENMSFESNPWDTLIKVKFTGAGLTGKKLRDLNSDELARVYKAIQTVPKPGVAMKHLLTQIEKCLSGAPKDIPQ
jgi:hypothetical protein